jgi:hypothetical protein
MDTQEIVRAVHKTTSVLVGFEWQPFDQTTVLRLREHAGGSLVLRVSRWPRTGTIWMVCASPFSWSRGTPANQSLHLTGGRDGSTMSTAHQPAGG